MSVNVPQLTTEPPSSRRPDQGATVVVPTLNRGGFLPDCLRDLLAQRHRPLEILVVDQSSAVDGEVLRLADQHADTISYHRVRFRGLPKARNYGWQQAKHDAIVYVDDDIRCGPTLVGEHVRALGLPNVGLVAGGIDEANKPLDIGSRTGSYRSWTATALRGFAAGGEHDVDHAPGGNFSAWRQVLIAVGGVDEGLSVGAALHEETDLCLRIKRAGYRVYFNGRARLTHLAAATGGCRVDEVPAYVYALARNRSVLIRRHSRWYQVPVALGRSLGLGGAYAWCYRSPGALIGCVAGCFRGWREGGRPPACTDHSRGSRA